MVGEFVECTGRMKRKYDYEDDRIGEWTGINELKERRMNEK